MKIIQRWIQPGQQHGRRFPSINSLRTLFILCSRVSVFLADSTQQIHSLRASGVISSQVISAFLIETIAFSKSAGILWTTPDEIPFLFIRKLYQKFTIFSYKLFLMHV